MPLPPGLQALLPPLPSPSSLPLPPPPPALLRRLHPLLMVPVRLMPFPLQRRLLEHLLRDTFQTHAARVVIPQETGWQLPENTTALADAMRERVGATPAQLQLYSPHDWFSPVASGSAAPRRMVICPCSMGTLAAIAHGMSDNLIERAADVIIKERGQLLLVPREMPFSEIHLDNMSRLARLGAMIMPAAPGFYHRPHTISDLVDQVVARLLDQLGMNHSLGPRWGDPA